MKGSWCRNDRQERSDRRKWVVEKWRGKMSSINISLLVISLAVVTSVVVSSAVVSSTVVSLTLGSDLIIGNNECLD